MKQLKRILCICLTMAMLLTQLPPTAVFADDTAATSGTCGDDLTWTFADGVLTISGTGPMEDYTEAAITDVPWYPVRSQITEVIIEEGVTTIGNVAFSNCTSLVSVTIPDGVTRIGDTAFFWCKSLKSVNIPDSVTYLGSFAFGSCSSLETAHLPAGLNTMGSYVFSGCESLTTVEIPEGATILWYFAFLNCENLTSITLPDSLKKIGEGVFSGCDGLTSFSLGPNVLEIGDGAFAYCENLERIQVDPDNPYYSTDEHGVLYNKDCTLLIQAPRKLSGSYSVADTVTVIGSRAFWYCESLTQITFPDTLTEIDKYAFVNCSGLTETSLPNGLTTLGSGAFSGCEGLTQVSLPDSLTTIGENAFDFCRSLATIQIPASVTSIGAHAFSQCEALDGIWVDENNVHYANDASGVLFNKAQTALLMAPPTLSGSYTVPATVTSIAASAFSGSSNMTEIILPDSLISIGEYAFSDCDGLYDIVIPDSATDLGAGLLDNCSNLNTVTFPDGITAIPDSFLFCSNIPEVTLPSTVTSIGSMAFSNCRKLTSFTIPSSVTEIGNMAFWDSNNLTEIWFKGSAPTFGNSVFSGVTAVAYYPQDDDSWNTETMLDYGGSITWVPYDPSVVLEITAGLGVADLAGFPLTGYGENSSVQMTVSENGTYTLTYHGSISDETSLGYLMIDLVDGIAYEDQYYLTLALKDLTVLVDGEPVEVDLSKVQTGDLEGNGNWRIQIYNMEAEENALGRGLKFAESLEVTFTLSAVRKCGDDAYWSLDNGTLTIYGSGDMYDFDTDYVSPWLAYNDEITSVVIGNGISRVGIAAFHSLTNLKKVTFGQDVTSIGDVAFVGCSALTTVELNDGLYTIGEFAFGSSGLREITIPGTVGNMTASVFFECTNLKTVVFEEGVTDLGGQTFDGCTALESVTVPGTVKKISTSLFNNCTALKEVILGEGVEEISYSVFHNCTALTGITLPSTLKTINHGAFEGAGLVSIVIPEGVTTLGMNCFDSCTELLDVTLPSTLTQLSIAAFYNCTSLEKVNFSEGLTTICTGAFRNCTSLAEVNLPESLTALWGTVFQGCTSLKSIVIPENVTTMYWQIFDGCTSLTEIFFLGQAPSNVDEDGTTVYPPLEGLTATAYYPGGDTWTEELRASYGGDITWVDLYAILDGDDEVFDISQSEEVAVRVDGSIDEFVEVYVDDELVDPSNYTVTEGSTIVTFTEAFLQELEYGQHTVAFYFENGAAVTTLEVVCTHSGMTHYAPVAPGCETNGHNGYYICGSCGKVFKEDGVTETTVADEYLGSTGHTWDDGTYTAPTCTADGCTTYTCHCGESYTVCEENSATGHAGGIPVIENYTLSVTGCYYEEVTYCNNCGKELFRIPVEFGLLGDVNDDGAIDIMDANLVAAYYNERLDLTSNQQLLADVNRDGDIDIMDANLIAAYYNERIDDFPIAN